MHTAEFAMLFYCVMVAIANKCMSLKLVLADRLEVNKAADKIKDAE